MSALVDVLIPAAAKDYTVLPYTVAAVQSLWPELAVHVLTPTPVPVTNETASYHLDAEALDFPLDQARFDWRPAWCAQQFLKLGNVVTTTPFFFVVQGDVIPLRRFELFNAQGRPRLFTGLPQYCPEYFTFSETMFGIGKVCAESFITECTLYSRDWIAEMVAAAGCADMQAFATKAQGAIHVGCFPAEQEMYGSFVWAKHQSECALTPLRIHLGGRYQGEGPWTVAGIDAHLRTLRGKVYDYAALHAWWDAEVGETT